MPSLKNWIYKGLIAYGMFRVGCFVVRKALNLFNRLHKSMSTLRSIYAGEAPPYAIITGGTHGIGLEFAKQLASAGFNIILMARDKDRMKEVQTQLRDAYKVDVISVVADFSKGDKEDFWKGIQETIKSLDIAILVNNVGKYDWTSLIEQKEENIQQLLSMNVFTPTVMSRLVLPKMLARGSRSAVINISSFIGEVSIPKTAVNAGSKRYVTHFTKCLANEYFDKRIDFLAVIPGFTDTGGLSRFTFGKPILVSQPTELVQGALKDIKIANQIGNISYGTVKTSFFVWLLKNPITSSYFLNKIAGGTMVQEY